MMKDLWDMGKDLLEEKGGHPCPLLFIWFVV